MLMWLPPDVCILIRAGFDSVIVNSAPFISSGVKSCLPAVEISVHIESMSRLAIGEGVVFMAAIKSQKDEV